MKQLALAIAFALTGCASTETWHKGHGAYGPCYYQGERPDWCGEGKP